MTGASEYICTRRTLSWRGLGYYMATAVKKDQEPQYAFLGPWVCIADASIYSQNAGSNPAAFILKLWLEKKKECISSLYGDFAFVIVNIETSEFFCGRDQLGVRPLFYAFHEGYFIFSSEIRHVYCVLGKPEIKEDYLLDTLITSKTKKGDSPFESIKRLIPAHYIEGSVDQININKYWVFNRNKKIHFNSIDAYIKLLREKVIHAVSIRCNDELTACELSGGLDSSAITGIAASFLEKQNKVLSAYSNILPEHTDLKFEDELDYIRAMQNFCFFQWEGINHIENTLTQLIKESIELHHSYIQQNFSVYNQDLYKAAYHNNIHVLLSGFGGDELVSARIAIQWNEMIREKQWGHIKDELFSDGITAGNLLKAYLLPVKFFASSLHGRYTTGPFNKSLLNKKFNALPLKTVFAARHKLKFRLTEIYNRPRRNQLSMKLVDRVLHDHVAQRMEYCYAVAAQYGLEYRYPLLDLNLLETVLAFPAWVLHYHGKNRYLFREAITGFVPEKIRNRNEKSNSTIPQMYFNLIRDRNQIMALIDKIPDFPLLNEVFDHSNFKEWYHKMVKQDPKETRFLMGGAFFNYLMIICYYLEHPNP